MKHTTRFLILAAAAVGAAGVATTGWAYWSASGTGTGIAVVGTWKTDTTTAVISSGSPSLVAEQVTYTATVTPAGAGNPTGNVAFFDGGSPIAGCGGAAGVALSGSTATCAQTYPAVGSRSITARYLGDADFNPSPESAAITQVVNKGTTSTSLSVTGSPAVYGSEDQVIFTSSVTTAAGIPTGAVTIKQHDATLCSIDLPATTCSPGSAALDASPTVYSITAVYSGDDTYLGSTSPAQDLTVVKAEPVINWIPAAITYGTPLGAGQLNATADTAGTFTYNPPADTILDAGSQSLNVTFHPDDTTNFDSTTAGRTLTVHKAGQTVSFTSTAPTAAKFGGSYTASATATSGLTVSFSSATTAVCTVSGSTVSFVGVGSCTINANQAGNSNWNAAAQAQQTFAVGKADQTITFAGPAGGTAGTTAALSATSTSGLTVSFASTTGTVCTVTGTTVNYLAAGTCTINANQAGDTNWNAAPQVSRSSTVTVELHISNLTGAKAIFNPSQWKATVTVTVQDTAGNPVNGVTVTGSWNPTDSNNSCTTEADGRCSFTTGNLSRSTVNSATWTVSNLTKPNHTYNPTVNTESSETITKP